MIASESQRPFRAALIVYLAFLLLLLGTSFLSSLRLWSVNNYAYLPWPVTAVMLLAGTTLAAILIRWSAGGYALPAKGRRRTYLWTVVLVSAAYVVLFYLLRARTHFPSDGYLVLTRVATETPPVRPWLQPAHTVVDFLARFTGDRARGGALLAFELQAYLCGAVFVGLAAWAAVRLFATLRQRLIFFFGLITGGYAALFFGYVSAFTLFVLCTAAFSVLGLLAVRGKAPRWLAALAFVAAAWLHPLALTLVPALIYVFVHGFRVERWFLRRPAALRWVALALVAAAAGAVFLHFYTSSHFFRFLVVPLTPDQFAVEGYWLLSLKHLLDYANLLVLLVPAVVVAVVAARYDGLPDHKWHPEYRFLLWATIPGLLAAFFIDPKIGMPRDWDMLAFAGVPLALLAFYYICDVKLLVRPRAAAGYLAVALSVLLLVPRLGVQVSPPAAISQFDRWSELDFYKNGTGRYVLLEYLKERGRWDEIERRRTEYGERATFEVREREGQNFMRQGEDLKAIERFKEAIAVAPTYANAWTNLALAYYKLGQLDSATNYIRIANALNPYNVKTYNSEGMMLYQRDDSVRAEELWRAALEIDPYNAETYSWLMVLYKQQGRQVDYDRAESGLLEQAGHDNAPLDLISAAARIYLIKRNYEAASREYRRALAKGLDTAQVRALQQQHPDLKVLDIGK